MVADSAAFVVRVPVPAGPVVLAEQLVPAPVPVLVRWRPVVLAHRALDPVAPVQRLPNRQSSSAAMARTTT